MVVVEVLVMLPAPIQAAIEVVVLVGIRIRIPGVPAMSSDVAGHCGTPLQCIMKSGWAHGPCFPGIDVQLRSFL